MAGVDRRVKRQWSNNTNLETDSYEDAFKEIFEQVNKLVTDVNGLRGYIRNLDAVSNVEFVASAGCNLAENGNPEDLQTGTTIVCQYRGEFFSAIADAAAVVATILGTGNTIGADEFGVIWVFGNKTASIGMAVASAAETNLTNIAALAQPMPDAPTEGEVPIACLMIEADSSVWEWGHSTNGEIQLDSASEAYYNFLNRPYITSAMVSFALDAAAATFTYGAATGVLGTGTALTITGKVNVVFPTGELTAITPGNVGAFILYALADDDEIPVQIGAAYADLQTARVAVDDLNPNPLLVELGRIYIENDSDVDFVPATTNLDATGITVTFETTQVRGAFLAPTDLVAATITTPESGD